MHSVVHTDKAPAAVGPYSQAIRYGNMIFSAGQVALDPEKGVLMGDDVAAQTEQVFRNLQAVLSAAGSDLSKVIKTTVFLTTMDHFNAMNEVYARHFPNHPPARSTVAVCALPKAALVEIEVVAYTD
ncbi:RidA family protein [bacterium]|nr:RidA family protein [bacterium]